MFSPHLSKQKFSTNSTKNSCGDASDTWTKGSHSITSLNYLNVHCNTVQGLRGAKKFFRIPAFSSSSCPLTRIKDRWHKFSVSFGGLVASVDEASVTLLVIIPTPVPTHHPKHLLQHPRYNNGFFVLQSLCFWRDLNAVLSWSGNQATQWSAKQRFSSARGTLPSGRRGPASQQLFF